MKQICLLLLALPVTISCTRESTNLNARALAEGQTYSTKFGGEDADETMLNLSDDIAFFRAPVVDTSLQISSFIRTVFHDKSLKRQSSNIWFGTSFNGVYRYSLNPSKCGSAFMSYTTKNGLAGNVVREVTKDHKGNIWIATNGGVSRYNISIDARIGGETFTNFDISDGLCSNEVWSVIEDRDGKMWFGTDKGVCFFNGKTFSKFPLPEVDLTNFRGVYPAPALVNKIFQDKSGYIWFGTNGGGVYRYDPYFQLTASALSNPEEAGYLIHFTEADGLCNNFVQGIFQDRSGNIWLSTKFGGVSRYNDSVEATSKQFTNFSMENGLSSNSIWNVFEDSHGNFWFATAGKGVDFCDAATALNNENKFITTCRKKFINYSIRNGLASEYVQSIAEDEYGMIWFGTGQGVSSFYPNNELMYNQKQFMSYPSNREGC